MLNPCKLQDDRPEVSLAHSDRSAKQLIISFISLASFVHSFLYPCMGEARYVRSKRATRLVFFRHIGHYQLIQQCNIQKPTMCMQAIKEPQNTQRHNDQYRHNIVPCARPTSDTEHQSSTIGSFHCIENKRREDPCNLFGFPDN